MERTLDTARGFFSRIFYHEWTTKGFQTRVLTEHNDAKKADARITVEIFELTSDRAIIIPLASPMASDDRKDEILSGEENEFRVERTLVNAIREDSHRVTSRLLQFLC